MPLANRSILVQFTGDPDFNVSASAIENTNTPAEVRLVTLQLGSNVIEFPTAGDVTGITIIPPSYNTIPLTLKGDIADVGIPLSKTDPTSLGVLSSSSSFILVAGTTLHGVRIIFN